MKESPSGPCSVAAKKAKPSLMFFQNTFFPNGSRGIVIQVFGYLYTEYTHYNTY